MKKGGRKTEVENVEKYLRLLRLLLASLDNGIVESRGSRRTAVPRVIFQKLRFPFPASPSGKIRKKICYLPA